MGMLFKIGQEIDMLPLGLVVSLVPVLFDDV